jgi:hypothetical protein
MTHAIMCIACMSMGGHFVPINIVLSVLYYQYDTGLHIQGNKYNYIMISHHIISSILLVITYWTEPLWIIRTGLFIIEFSNLPIYWTQFYVWSDSNKKHPAIYFLILLEIISFMFVRCLALIIFIVWFVKNIFVRMGLTLILAGSLYWTNRLFKLLQ